MIAISNSDYQKYGCPKCGCDSSILSRCYTGDTHPVTCRECKENFVILADGLKKSSLGFGYNAGYPELQEHPRKGTPWHPWIAPDPRPEYGEYWNPRGIGYDLSGFVQSKQAGERLLDMVKDVLGKDNPESWLDWREYEPEWIQFKFQDSEFDLEKLKKKVIDNEKIITKEILMECKL
jgi:hypothetical protein